MNIAKTSIIYPGVKLGKNVKIGEYAIIGLAPRDYKEGELETIIGDNCEIRAHSVIYSGNKIGDDFQTGVGVSIREFNKIGNNVSIGTHSIIEHHIQIEENVRIHSNVFIPEYSFLKKECWIGPCVVITNVLHPKCPKAKECIKGATIGEKTIIGANVTILPDITITSECLIGSGSLVNKPIHEKGVYIGNPVKKIMEIKDINCRYNLIDNPYIRGGKE